MEEWFAIETNKTLKIQHTNDFKRDKGTFSMLLIQLHYILNTIPRNSHGWFWPFPRMVSIFSDSRQWSPLLGIPPNRLLAILPTPAAPPFYPSFLSISKHFRLCRTYFYLETLTSDGQTQLIHRLAFDDQCRTLASILLYTVPVPDCTRIRYTIRLKIIHPGLF
jgi:hypothetical protein